MGWFFMHAFLKNAFSLKLAMFLGYEIHYFRTKDFLIIAIVLVIVGLEVVVWATSVGELYY